MVMFCPGLTISSEGMKVGCGRVRTVKPDHDEVRLRIAPQITMSYSRKGVALS